MKKTVAVLASLAVASAGCSKIKAAIGHDDGGTENATSLSKLLNGFEGEIGIRASGDVARSGNNAPLDLTLDVKSNKLRADIPAGMAGPGPGLHGYGIFHTDEKKLFFVDDTKKQAIVIDMNKAGEHLTKAQSMGGPHSHSGATHPPPKVTKTGKTDTVAGHKCETWEIEDAEQHEKTQLCVADEGASWFHIPLVGAPAQMAWAGELLDGKHFPLRAIMLEASGTEKGRVEVTRIDKKSLDDALFEVPAGYTQVDLEQLFSVPAFSTPPLGRPRQR